MAHAAISRGIGIFGVSDHSPLFAHELDHPKPGTQMAKSEWTAYLDEATALRAELSGRLDLRVGTEADWLPGTEATYAEALAAAPLDYVLGSVHNIGPVHIYNRGTHALIGDVDELHRDYWRLTRAAVESGLFDILAHMDAAKARLPRAGIDLSAEVGATLDCIADNGIAVEVNTAGLRKTDELFPAPGILDGLVARGVPITFGSDSHRVGEVGFGWAEARAELGRLGVTRLAAFRNRELEWVPLG